MKIVTGPDQVLAQIFAEYRPYDAMPAFMEGYRAYHLDGPHRLNPHSADSVAAQAFDRGASAAMLYRRALDHMERHPDAVEQDGPGWIVNFIRMGGR